MTTQTSRQETVFAIVTTLVGLGLWAVLVAELAIKVAQPIVA